MAHVQSKKLTFARDLRRNQTDTELVMWQILRSRQLDGYKFRRQRVIGPYIVDFCCLNPKLIIELDGSQHTDNADYDETRTKFLQSEGFEVLRFWDNEALQNRDGVTEAILRALTLALSHVPRERG